MTKQILLLLLFIVISLKGFAQKMQGIVLDRSNREPIAFAEVFLPELGTGITTDVNGKFTLEHVVGSMLHLRISYIGYTTLDTILQFRNDETVFSFFLEPGHYKLKEVIVSVPTGKLQQDAVVNVAHVSLENLQLAAPASLAESISSMPGVDQNSTGVGIGKPVIRGLSGNRIVSYAQGVRIENQQWGDEHGLGIGEAGIESVELIKGPASLLYGADALGGVLYFIDERYARHNTIELNAHTAWMSNTAGRVIDGAFKGHLGKFKMNLFGAYGSHADYAVPSNKRVFNTRFDARNVKSSFGFNTSNWIANLRYSYLQNHFGIADTAIYISEVERKFVLPFQTIDNHLMSFENNIFLGDSKIIAILGWSQNYRREFEDDPEQQALGLKLRTFTYNLKWQKPAFGDRVKFVAGAQGMAQGNVNNGEDILIPDAKIRDIGFFGLANIELSGFQIQSGLRWDHRRINSLATGRIPALKGDYNGISFSLGGSYHRKNAKVRANISSGFRSPNTSELLSDGVHEGTNRYEIGNTELKSEKATQVDMSINLFNEHLHFTIDPFVNFIRDYIYLNPTTEHKKGVPVYEYRQTNAYLYGGEIGIHYHPHSLHLLHLESDFSMVLAKDARGNVLPLIPQHKLNTGLRLELPEHHRLNLSGIFVNHLYKFARQSVAVNETPADSYHLVNAGISLSLKDKQYPLQIRAGIKNVFNAVYIDHLSRFKQLGIPAPGRSFFVDVRVGLHSKF